MAWVATAIVGTSAIGGLGSWLGGEAQAGAARDAAGASADAARYQADVQREIYNQSREDQAPWREAGANALAALSQGVGVATNPQIDREQFRIATPGSVHGMFGGMWVPALAQYDEAAYRAAVDDAQRAQRESPGFGDLTRPFSMADYEADPGYAFRQAEGMRAIERSAAARGGALSGGALRGIQRFGQGLASEEYGNAFNRYQANQTNRYNRLASLAGVGQTANAATGAAGSNYANAITGISQANATNQGNAMLAAGNARASGYAGIGNAAGNALAAIPYIRGGFGGGGRGGYGYGYGGGTLI